MIRQNFRNFLKDKQFWSIILVVPLLIILITSLSPNIAHALTATPTRTPTPTNTNTPMIAGDLGYGSVHGTVTSASTGAPISGAVVTCSHTSFTSPAKCSGTRTTGADGMYVFSNVFFHDTDHISVTAQAAGYTQQTIQQNFFTTPNMTANFSLALSPPTCGTTVVVTSTPTKTPSPTPSATPSATPTKTPTPTNTACGPIYITATPTGTTPPGLPDLIVQSMSISGNQPCFGPGFQLGVRVTVANIGAGNAGSFVVNVNGATQTVSGGLPAGQTTTLWFPGYNSGSPNTATVDSTNLVTESNENNNTLSQQLPVPTPPPNCPTPTPTPTSPPGLPDLVVTSLRGARRTAPSGCIYSPTLGLQVIVQNAGAANAGTFLVEVNNNVGARQTVSGLAAGQSTTLWFNISPAPITNTATADVTNLVVESNESNNTLTIITPGNQTATPTSTGTLPVICTLTPTPGTPTHTPTRTATPTRTNTPGTPTATPTRTNTPGTPTATPTRTNTPSSGDLCASPTVITGGGSYAVPAGGVCFKYVNAAFTPGAMWSVMNGSDSTVSNVVKWYGGRNESVTNCINDSQTLNGNGAQINNFTVAKDSANAMYVTITTNQANTVSMNIQNWQNGTGCSVAPTPRP